MHNHRRYKAYFNQKSVSFQNAVPPERFEGVFLDAPLDLSLNIVLKLFGENENVWVKCRDPKHDFERFCDGFTRVEAAGGLVRDTSGKILMIYRRGRWDLPKGHVEPGESSEDAALREVSEECGIRKLDIAGYITDTWHFYNTFGDWEMKRTHWFSMVCSDCSIPKPQTSEDIEKAVWLEGDALRTAVQDSYRTIQDVFATAAEPRHQNCRHIE